MIKELYLKNWKSFTDGKLYIDPLTIVIGTNASGKSNILDALLFLQKISFGKEVTATIGGDSESKGIRGGVSWAITSGFDEAEIKTIISSNLQEGVDYEYSILIGRLDDNRFEIKSESLYRTQKVKKRLFETSNDTPESPGIITYYSTGTQGRGKRIDLRRSHTVLSQSIALPLQKEVQLGVSEVIEQLTNIFVLDPIPSLMRSFSKFSDRLNFDASNISGVIAALDAEKKLTIENTITDYLKQFPENDLEKIWAVPVGIFNTDAMLYSQEKWFNNSPLTVDARGMSDGTLRFLAIITALLTIKEESLLVIEEIDNGFHPSRAKLLVKMLKEISAKRKIDVLCTTHNPAFLDALGNEMIVFISVTYRDAKDGTSKIKLLEEIEDLPKLIARGTIGQLATNRLIEQALTK